MHSAGHERCKVPEEFYLRIVNASYEIYQRQMRYVDMSVKVADYLYQNTLMYSMSVSLHFQICLGDKIEVLCFLNCFLKKKTIANFGTVKLRKYLEKNSEGSQVKWHRGLHDT